MTNKFNTELAKLNSRYFHDGIIEFYELTTHKRTNVNLCGTGMHRRNITHGERRAV